MKNTKFPFIRLSSTILAISISLSLFSSAITVNASSLDSPPYAPSWIYVEAIDSDTIKLEWGAVLDADYYEIYATNNSNAYVNDTYIYVGSVSTQEVSQGRLRYYVDGLNANSGYSFKLKAVNEDGPSSLSYRSNYIMTKDKKIINDYQITEDYIGSIAQNDKTNILGNNLTFIAGENSFGNYGSGLKINLNSTIYMNYNIKNVDMGLGLLRKYPNNTIAIDEKDFSLKMLGKNLLGKETDTVSDEKLHDSKLTMAVMKDLKAKGDEIKLKVPKGYKALTSPVGISLTMQVEDIKTKIKTFNDGADISFNISDASKKLYAGGIIITYYNNDNARLESISGKSVGNTLVARITRPGEYILLGKFSK